jgi:hypothetical protein
MLVNNHFVYVLMPRTGSTRISQILMQLTDAEEMGRKHDRLCSKPRDQLIFGSIRNPWAWYVSLWAWRARGVNPISRALFKDDPVWRRYYTEDRPELFRAWLREIQHPSNASLLPWGYGEYANSQREGFMTFKYRHLYPDGLVDMWIKLEELVPTLGRALRAAGYTIPHRLLDSLCEVRYNATSHGPWQSYYDEETFELVRRREMVIVERHAYSRYQITA